MHQLSRTGRAVLSNPAPLPPHAKLLLLILDRTGGASKENATALATDLILQCGSAESAIVALENGEFGFEKVSA